MKPQNHRRPHRLTHRKIAALPNAQQAPTAAPQARRLHTAEGRERAKKRGVRLARRPKLTAHQQQEARRRKKDGEPIRDIAPSYNVHNSTISRLTA